MFQWNFIIFYYLQRSFRFSGSTVDFHSMQTHLIFIKVTKKLCRFCFANTSFWRRKKYTHTSNCVSWTISHKVNLKRIVSKAAETAEWLERKSQKEPSGIHWMMQVKKKSQSCLFPLRIFISFSVLFLYLLAGSSSVVHSVSVQCAPSHMDCYCEHCTNSELLNFVTVLWLHHHKTWLTMFISHTFHWLTVLFVYLFNSETFTNKTLRDFVVGFFGFK